MSPVKCRRTANSRILNCTRGRDNGFIKLVAKSKDFRLYSTDIDINGKYSIKRDIKYGLKELNYMSTLRCSLTAELSYCQFITTKDSH